MRRAIALTLGCAVLLVACSGSAEVDDTSTTTSTTGPPGSSVPGSSTTTEAVELKPYGGEFVFARRGPLAPINPFLDPTGTSYFQGHHLAGARLWNGEWVPDLIVTNPTFDNGLLQPDGDRLRVEFAIRDEAVWEDGAPISGDDFMFTYEQVMANLERLDPVTFERYGLIEPDTIEVGPKRFAFWFTPASMQWEFLFDVVLPRHQMEGTSLLEDWNDRAWLSAAAFRVVSYDPAGDLVFERNDNYWRDDPDTGQRYPYLDRLVFRSYPGDNARQTIIEQFYAGELDETDVMFPPEARQALDTFPDAVVSHSTGGAWELLTFGFGERRLDANPDSLVEHLEFRQAIAYALDVAALADESTLGTEPPLWSYVEHFSPALSSGAWRQYDHDPERARQLLDQLCFELARDCMEDPPLLVYHSPEFPPFRPVLAQSIADMLDDVGIETEFIFYEDVTALNPVLYVGALEVAEFAWISGPGLGSLVSVHNLWHPDLVPPEDGNVGRWGSEGATGFNDDPATPLDETQYNQGAAANAGTANVDRYREIVAAMNSTVDETEIAAFVREAEQLLADDLVIVPLFGRALQVVTRTSRFSAPPAAEVAIAIRPAFFLRYRTDLGSQARYDP